MHRSWRKPSLPGPSTALLAAALGCSGGGGEDAISEAAARGKTVYLNVCIACHAVDPTQDGPLGPAIDGATLPLLEAKVLRAEYPPGYAPKSAGITMPRYDYLAEQLPDVAAYLAELDR